MSEIDPAVLSKPLMPAHLQHEIRVIESIDAFRDLRAEWEALAALAKEYSQCVTYQYCELAAGLALAKGGIIVVTMVYRDGALQAIWPLATHRKGRLRIATALTCGSEEEYGALLVRGEESRAVFTAAVEAVMHIPADVLEVNWVQDGSILQESLESAPQSWLVTRLPLLPKRLSRQPGFSIRLRGFSRWDEFAATLPQGLRASLRRGLKRLSAKGHIETGWCTTTDDSDAVLTWLFANKRRWAQARGFNTQWLMNDQMRNFFIMLARQTNLSITPLVTFVKVDGVPVAASVNLVGSRSVEYFISTYDEAFRTYSVGSLLTDFLLRWSHANGRDFDFRPVYYEYKAYWANHETFHRPYIIFLTARGRLAEFSLLGFPIFRVKRKLRKITVHVLETVRAAISRFLMSSRSRQ